VEERERCYSFILFQTPHETFIKPYKNFKIKYKKTNDKKGTDQESVDVDLKYKKKVHQQPIHYDLYYSVKSKSKII
jgi:hypothetical protein